MDARIHYTDTDKRMIYKNNFEKEFFKLMNNSVYGKTLENVRQRQNIKLMTDERKLNKYITKPGFISSKFLTRI